MNDFVKERNEALLSLEKEKIIKYMDKYNIKYPEDEETFWAGVHKSICNLFLVPSNNITLEQFDRSYNWLEKNGYSPEIN